LPKNDFLGKDEKEKLIKELFEEYINIISEDNKWIGELGYLLHFSNS